MYRKFFKRVIDIVLSGAALVILAVPMMIFALIIKHEDKGPALFRQKRIGIHKKTFSMYKFRSMKMNTPHDVPTHLLTNPEQYILRCGQWMRKYSVDELPQILNIMKGDMSIVGPRPALWNQYDLIAERDKYGANDIRGGRKLTDAMSWRFRRRRNLTANMSCVKVLVLTLCACCGQ